MAFEKSGRGNFADLAPVPVWAWADDGFSNGEPIQGRSETDMDVIQTATDEPNRREYIEPVEAESLTTM